MASKGKKTTRESLTKMFTTETTNSKIAIELMMKLVENKLVMERQAVYEDDIFFNEEFYGEVGDLGVTVRFQKKQMGLTGKYYMMIETETGTVEFKTRVASKAWSLCLKQENIREDEYVADESTLTDLLTQLTEES